MLKIPSLKSLQDIFFDEDKCINFLFNENILQFQRCPTCNYNTYRDKKIFRCLDLNCRKAVSIFDKTFFSGRHLKCSDVMLIGYYWLCNANYTMILNMSGHSSTTVSKYIKLFRQLVINMLVDNDEIIGGNNIIVEVDESKFHSRKDGEGIWIVGGVEKTLGKKCFFKVVRNRDARTIRQIIRTHVNPGSIICTDMW
ncbi:MAG TPA: hypothetical protein VIY08_01285 [Candidatus Nitrosocosmicus sp.]